MENLVDIIVIGGGLSGLVAARNAIRMGFSVLLLESRERLGGRTYTILSPSNNFVELGNEWILNHQKEIKKEMEVYGLSFHRENVNNICYSFQRGTKLSNQLKSPIPDSEIELKKIFDQINYHANLFKFSSLSDPYSIREFDISFTDYLSFNLGITDPVVQEFLLSKVSHFMGGDPSLFSTTDFLRKLKEFRSAEHLFLSSLYSSTSPFFKSIDGGSGRLVECIANEIRSLGGQILLDSPVLSVRMMKPDTPSSTPSLAPTPYPSVPPTPSPHSSSPHPSPLSLPRLISPPTQTNPSTSRSGLIRPPTLPPPPLIQVTLLSGESFLSRSVFVSVPMTCLSSLHFSPPLPQALSSAIRNCNVSRRSKFIAEGRGVSRNVDEIVSWPGSVHSYVKKRFPNRERKETNNKDRERTQRRSIKGDMSNKISRKSKQTKDSEEQEDVEFPDPPSPPPEPVQLSVEIDSDFPVSGGEGMGSLSYSIDDAIQYSLRTCSLGSSQGRPRTRPSAPSLPTTFTLDSPDESTSHPPSPNIPSSPPRPPISSSSSSSSPPSSLSRFPAPPSTSTPTSTRFPPLTPTTLSSRGGIKEMSLQPQDKSLNHPSSSEKQQQPSDSPPPPPPSHFAQVVFTTIDHNGSESLDKFQASLARSHHPTMTLDFLLTHDFERDPWARSSGFVLRAGCCESYAAACQLAQKPWASDPSSPNHLSQLHSETRSRSHLSSMPSSTDQDQVETHTKNPTLACSFSGPFFYSETGHRSQVKDDALERLIRRAKPLPPSIAPPLPSVHPQLNLSPLESLPPHLGLVIGGSDFAINGWNGWMEGSLTSGAECAERLFAYLRPPKPIFNLTKKTSRVTTHSF